MFVVFIAFPSFWGPFWAIFDRSAESGPKRPPEARKSDKNTANKQQVTFFKLYFDFNVFSAENSRLF